jgi:hypothetical protein
MTRQKSPASITISSPSEPELRLPPAGPVSFSRGRSGDDHEMLMRESDDAGAAVEWALCRFSLIDFRRVPGSRFEDRRRERESSPEKTTLLFG